MEISKWLQIGWRMTTDPNCVAKRTISTFLHLSRCKRVKRRRTKWKVLHLKMIPWIIPSFKFRSACLIFKIPGYMMHPDKQPNSCSTCPFMWKGIRDIELHQQHHKFWNGQACPTPYLYTFSCGWRFMFVYLSNFRAIGSWSFSRSELPLPVADQFLRLKRFYYDPFWTSWIIHKKILIANYRFPRVIEILSFKV